MLLLLNHVLVVYADLLVQFQLTLRVPHHVLEVSEFIKVIDCRKLVVPCSLRSFLLQRHLTLQPVNFVLDLLL